MRKDLEEELKYHKDHYKFFGTDYEKMLKAIPVKTSNEVGTSKWLVVPDMLVVAANAYGRPCVTVSANNPMTFLPTRVSPTHSTSQSPLLLCFINGNHFISASLVGKADTVVPYPPVLKMYDRHNKRAWTAWHDLLQKNLALWETKQQSLGNKKRCVVSCHAYKSPFSCTSCISLLVIIIRLWFMHLLFFTLIFA